MDVTGSSYEGRMKDRRMHGHGRYVFPTGTVYEGEFRDGMFHGSGSLTLKEGGKFVGEWRKGVAIEGHYVFADGLAMDDSTRPYCLKGLDRRFQSERVRGLRPAGRCQLTNLDPPRKVPFGHYDVGYGFYLPATKHVYCYDNPKFWEHPNPKTRSWIEKTCRKGWDEVVGFHNPDHAWPHPSDYSLYVHPDNKLSDVTLPPISDRSPQCPKQQSREIPLSVTRESETAMMSAAQLAVEGRRFVRSRGLHGLLTEAEKDRMREEEEEEDPQERLLKEEQKRGRRRGRYAGELHLRSHFGTRDVAAVSSASTSASSIDDGFGAVTRRDFPPRKSRKSAGTEAEREGGGADKSKLEEGTQEPTLRKSSARKTATIGVVGGPLVEIPKPVMKSKGDPTRRRWKEEEMTQQPASVEDGVVWIGCVGAASGTVVVEDALAEIEEAERKLLADAPRGSTKGPDVEES